MEKSYWRGQFWPNPDIQQFISWLVEETEAKDNSGSL